MRLVCPNCGAQYDVPLEVIPEAGRDVQCSNCGHTWFQRRVTQAAAAATSPEPHRSAEPDPDPATEAPEPDMTPVPEAVPARSIDPEMAELFREEREYEARRRATESLETQPDLGLESPADDDRARRARESRERMAKMRGEDLAQAPVRPEPAAQDSEPTHDDTALRAAAAEAAAASRREMLPDVDELNQSLRATSQRRAPDRKERKTAPAEHDSTERQTGSPFARGFMLTVLLFVILVALYAQSEDLSQRVPQAGPYFDAYVSAVDDGRAWLDAQVKSGLTLLDGMSSEAADPESADSN